MKRYIPVFIISIFIALNGYAQATRQVIKLPDAQFGFTAKEFYIEGVMDARKGKPAVASLITSGNSGAAPLTHPADFDGGTRNALLNFIRHNLTTDAGSRPVIIRINGFAINETAQGNAVKGEIKVDFSFMLKRQFDTIRLVDYAGGLAYMRPLQHNEIVEPTISNAIVRSLAWFNNWISKHADEDPVLAHSVKLSFTDFTEKPEGDTIYYSTKRPLTWDDFTGKVIDHRFDAEVMPSIGYAENVKVVKGVICVNLAMKTYLPKSASWVNGPQSDYALNHEQRHFDIVKIITERFKKKLLEEKLPPENYDGPINVAYLEYFTMMNQMQKQYDADTRHGTNRAAQDEWDKKVDAELKNFGIK